MRHTFFDPFEEDPFTVEALEADIVAVDGREERLTGRKATEMLLSPEPRRLNPIILLG